MKAAAFLLAFLARSVLVIVAGAIAQRLGTYVVDREERDSILWWPEDR